MLFFWMVLVNDDDQRDSNVMSNHFIYNGEQ